jgi:hypothetical protein
MFHPLAWGPFGPWHMAHLWSQMMQGGGQGQATEAGEVGGAGLTAEEHAQLQNLLARAQAQYQPQPQAQSQPQAQYQPQYQPQAQSQPQAQYQPQYQPQAQSQPQAQPWRVERSEPQPVTQQQQFQPVAPVMNPVEPFGTRHRWYPGF